MSWQEHLTTIVRVLINDLDCPYEFSDERMQQVIVVAAKYVQFDVNLEHLYQVNVINPNITPDPTNDDDEIFLSLVGLKAACIFDQGTFRTKSALEGINTRLGAASLSFGGSIAAVEAKRTVWFDGRSRDAITSTRACNFRRRSRAHVTSWTRDWGCGAKVTERSLRTCD
jgi:hypothetical protein